MWWSCGLVLLTTCWTAPRTIMACQQENGGISCHPNKMSETHRHQKNTTLGKTLIQNAASTHTLSSLTGSYTTCSQIIKSIYPVMEMTFGAIFNVGKFSSSFMNSYHFHHWDIFTIFFTEFWICYGIFPIYSNFHTQLSRRCLEGWSPKIHWSISKPRGQYQLSSSQQYCNTQTIKQKQNVIIANSLIIDFLSAKSSSDLFRNLLRGLYSILIFHFSELNLML